MTYSYPDPTKVAAYNKKDPRAGACARTPPKSGAKRADVLHYGLTFQLDP